MKNKSSKKSRKTVNIFWLILSIIGIITLIYLVIKSTTLGMFYVRTSGSPSTSVTEFYNALFKSDYDTACTYLKDYDALGMVNDPETFEGKVTFDALKASYSMNLIGSPTIDKLKATQRVSFTYLDIRQKSSNARTRSYITIAHSCHRYNCPINTIRNIFKTIRILTIFHDIHYRSDRNDQNNSKQEENNNFMLALFERLQQQISFVEK